jgi:hypothetical protein
MNAPKEIWIGRGNDQLGPHPLERIRQLSAAGRLQAEDLLWWDGLAEWTPRDAALPLLGIEVAAAPATPPPLPRSPTPPPSAVDPAQREAALAQAERVLAAPGPAAQSAERARALLWGFMGLVMFAVIAAAAFAYLRAPGTPRPSFGLGSGTVHDVLNAAAMYKVAYAEYVVSSGKTPESLAEIGLQSSPYGALKQVRIESGTLLFDTSLGMLALQPYRNENYQIGFRCGRAAPPDGMMPLGMIDSASATTIDPGELPDDCR